jgi:hypothetical protein
MALKAEALGWPAEAAVAAASSRVLASHLQDAGPVELRLADGTPLAVPAPALRLLVRLLEEMGRGNAVTVIPVQRELTTQQAADMLQISRPSLIELLEQKETRIPPRRHPPAGGTRSGGEAPAAAGRKAPQGTGRADGVRGGKN